MLFAERYTFIGSCLVEVDFVSDTSPALVALPDLRLVALPDRVIPGMEPPVVPAFYR